MSSFFTQDALEGRVFCSLEAAFRHMQVQAMKEGFEIGCSQSFESVYGTFYCLRGGRIRGTKSTKTGCAWHVKLGTAREEGRGFVKVIEVAGEHNHDCHPDVYSVFTCGEREQDLIRKMRECSIAPRKIVKLMERLGLEGITTRQINRLVGAAHVEMEGTVESRELEGYVRENGGEFFPYIISEDGKEFCHGCLSIMPFEKDNLEKFSSVMFIDGTQNTSRLGWEMLPITLVDQYRRIRSGGVAFMAYTDAASLTWLLSQISKLPPVQANTRTLISDEDSAFIPALTDIRSSWPVNHVLCAFHKEKNFAQKLSKCGLTALERSVAKDLFKCVCYSTHKDAVESAISSLGKMHSKISSYLEKHIVPTLCQFSRAYLSDVWTKGYNTTSPAEAHNAMYKRYAPGTTASLKQMRIDFTGAHLEAEKSFNQSVVRSFNNEHFTFRLGGLMLSPKIRKLIDESCREAEKYCATPDGDGKFKVFMASSADVYHIADARSCTCGRLTHEGLPCHHILRVIRDQGGEWPFDLVHKDWVIQSPEHVIAPFDRNGDMSDQDMDEPGIEVAEQDITAHSDSLTPDGNHVLVEEDIVQITTNMPVYRQAKRRYLKMYHLMKMVVSAASKEAESSQLLMRELLKMKAMLFSIPEGAEDMGAEFREEDEADGDTASTTKATVDGLEAASVEPSIREDVQDVTGRRRGRKRKSVLEPYHVQRRGEACYLCGKKHEVTRCRLYKDYAAARNHNADLPEDSNRHRCRVCLGYGHNAKTCTWLWINKQKK